MQNVQIERAGNACAMKQNEHDSPNTPVLKAGHSF